MSTSRCSSNHARPNRWACSTPQIVNQSSSMRRSPNSSAGVTGSIARSNTSANRAEAAANGSAASAGSGPKSVNRSIEKTRPIEGSRSDGRASCVDGSPGVGPAQHVEQHLEVVGLRRERPVGRQIDPVGDRVAADHAVRRLQAHEPAVRGRDPDAAAAVGRRRDRRHARRQRHRRPTGGAAAGPLGVPRVARRAEQVVGREALGGELRQVRLAHDDGAGRAEASHHHRIGRRGRRGREHARPERRPHARDIGHVLHEQRQPRERPGLRPRGELLVEQPRLRERLRSERDHRAEVCVERFDPPERPGDEFVRPDLARADLRGERPQRRHRRANMPSSS